EPMTTNTSAATHRPNWLVATKTLISAHLRVAGWFWGVIVTLLIGGHVLMSVIPPDRVLIAQYGTHGTTWFAFSLGVIIVLAYLPVHVTSGLTSRSFIRANLLTALLIGVFYGAGLALLVLIERLVFASSSAPGDAPGPVFVSDAIWGIFVGQSLLTVTALLCGALVSMAYYRTNPLLGTVLLIPTVGPVLAVMALTAGD